MRDLDQPHERAYCFDEIAMLKPWPAGALELFGSLGILAEMTESGPVWLDDCVDPDWADPTWLFSPAKGRVVGYCACGWGCGGTHVVERERARQWRPSFEGIARRIAAALSLNDGWIEDVPGRVRLLGAMEHNGQWREIFIVRGITWPDGPAVIAQAQRLARATKATLLCMAALPPLEHRPQAWQTVVSLQEIVAIQKGRLILPIARLFDDGALPAALPVAREALAEQDLDVLEALAARPKVALNITEIMAAAGYSKGTTRAILNRLKAVELVGHPPGTKRKGIAITAAGIAALKDASERG